MFENALVGLLVGFSVAAPIGPMGSLCISRTLSHGRRYGVMTGLGDSTVEAACAAVAALGLGAVTNAVVTYHVWLGVLGALVLLGLGLRTALARPVWTRTLAGHPLPLATYATAVGVAASNPMSVLPYTALCAAWALEGKPAGPLAAASLAMGVFAGAGLWWVLLSCTIDWLRTQFSPPLLPWVNRVSGSAIACVGLGTLAHTFG